MKAPFPFVQDRPERDAMGSSVSLDPDRLAKRNEERLRRLKDISGRTWHDIATFDKSVTS